MVLDVLIGPSESWKMHPVRTKFEIGATSFEHIFRMWLFNLIATATFIAVLVDRVQIEMVSFEFVIILLVVDDVGNECFFVVTTLIH